MVEFVIVNRRKRVKITKKRDGRVIIRAHLFTSFEDMRPVLEQQLSPRDLFEAERLWRDDEMIRSFKRQMRSVRMREKLL